MSVNPLEHKGIPLDKQIRTWSELNSTPTTSGRCTPTHARARVIVMNGIEVESIMFSHQFARHTDVPEVKERLAEVRRIEQQQQKVINWLTPGDETTRGHARLRAGGRRPDRVGRPARSRTPT